MSEHNLPRSWTLGTLSHIADVVQGQSPPGSTYNVVGNGVPFFQGKAEFGPIHPIAAKWCTEPTKIAEPGDVLITIRAPVGPTNLADTRCCIGRGLAAIRPADQIPSRFLLYYLRHTEWRLARQATGSTFQAISGSQLRDHPVVIPPRAEQHRIVCALESYFTRLDDAVATLKRVLRNLKRYRGSVINAAVEGRLVPTEADLSRAEGRNFEPASVLLTRILSERRRRWEEAEIAKMTARGKPPKDDKWKAKYVEPVAPDTSALPELPEGWCWASVDQVVVSLDQGWSPQCERRPVTTPQEWGVIKTSAVQHMAYVEEANKALPSSLEARPHLEVMANDILVTRAGPRVRVGVCCLVRRTSLRLMVCDKVYRIRTHPDDLAPDYMELVLNSPRALDVIERTKSGISDSGLNLTQDKFGEMAIPLAPRQEQTRIAAAVAMSFSLSDVVSEDAQRSCTRSMSLRRSILKWAFEGRLVDQDPTEETSSVLLERIRAERASAAVTPPRGDRQNARISRQ